MTTVTIGRESSMALIRHITNQTDDEGYFAVATQVDAEVESPQFDDLYPVGTLAKLLRVIELPDQKRRPSFKPMAAWRCTKVSPNKSLSSWRP